MRGWATALALLGTVLLSSCASFWSYDEADYFADLAAYTPAASTDPPPTPRPVVISPITASSLPEPVALEEPAELDFACSDGSRLRMTYSADRLTATARWSDGGSVVLARSDRDGVTRYVAPGASFWRAGRRIAWEGSGEVEVMEGDTLWKISERVFGDRGRGMEIAQLNADRVADPNLIYPGQRLRVPGGGEQRYCYRALTTARM